jgi:hypothetical protein
MREAHEPFLEQRQLLGSFKLFSSSIPFNIPQYKDDDPNVSRNFQFLQTPSGAPGSD